LMRPKPAVRIIFAPLARRGARKGHALYEAHLQGQAQGRTVWLDPRMPNVAKVLLHELIHVRHPSWPEDRVAAAEEYRWQHMGWKQKAKLYQMLGSARLEGDE
jgi:hypothetical protein